MPHSKTPSHGLGNNLLDLLAPSEYRAILPHCESVSLGAREVLFEPFQPIPFVHFPITAVLSVVKRLESGDVVEIMTVGCEGLSGLPLVLGGNSSANQCFVQVAGSATRIAADSFLGLIPTLGQHFGVLGRYAQVALNQVSQGVACNRLHSVEQRCARWLLMTRDRAGVDEFALTHEFLAFMLGVRRASVTEVEGTFREAGLIQSTRGKVRIIDRAGLEAASCECYQSVRAEYARLLGVTA